MFAKQKKAPQVTKTKPVGKTKTVSVKTGVKTPQNKKSKVKDKTPKSKPAARVDPGYSLYSTDSEDHVSSTFKEMEMCEKILIQLKNKQKGSPVKSKKTGKKGEESAPYDPSQILRNIPSYADHYSQYQSMLLRRLNHPDYSQTSNPVFNQRLTSSTPDPDKLLSDPVAGMPLGNRDQMMHEPPERDESTILTPNSTHVRNMADMADIYSQLEKYKIDELKEACSQHSPTVQISQNPGVKGPSSVGQAQMLGISRDPASGQLSQSAEFQGSSSSLGFTPVQSVPIVTQSGTLPVPVSVSLSGSQPSLQTPGLFHGRESTIAAFQPYISRDSLGSQPPQAWLMQQGTSTQSVVAIAERPIVEPLPLSRQPVRDVIEEPLSGRSEKSAASSGKHSSQTGNTSGTDYVILPKPGTSQDSEDQHPRGDVVFEKHNGLYQIHQKIPAEGSDGVNVHLPTQNTTEAQQSSNNAGVKTSPMVSPRQVQFQSEVHIQGSINEAPERDTSSQSSVKQSVPASDGNNFTSNTQGFSSQNTSEITTSTPRNQSTQSTFKGQFILQGGLPGNFTATPVAIGNPDQRMTGAVSYPIQQGPGSVVSSVVGCSDPQEVSGPYHRPVSAHAIAAGDIGIRKLRYLLKELRECSKCTKDVEISRLVKEVDIAVDAIPQLGVTFNLQTEIDLAIQPLRSENSQLRRKLRLINQYLREQEEEKAKEPKDTNFEMLHLQTSNETLQRVVREEKETKTRLAAEVQFLLNEIHKMKVEKSKFISDMSEKETEQLKLRQESLLETQTLRHEVDLLKKEVEVSQSKLEALEKENHILRITLQQRDDEINRQQQIVSTITDAMSDLLLELDQSYHGDKTWDHNKSFSLNKLLKVIEEETNVSFVAIDRQETARKTVSSSPEKRALRFNSTAGSTESTPRLTRAALANHNRKHSPREDTQGALSDTEVDNTLQELNGNVRRLSSGRPQTMGGATHRRTSSSSPVRLKAGRGEQFRHQRTASSPMYRLGMNENKGRRTWNRIVNRREEFDDTHGNISPDKNDFHQQREDVDRNFDGLTATSVDQSRYSVTDYFRKYPSSHQMMDSGKDSDRAEQIDRLRPLVSFRTSSEADDGTLRSDIRGPKRNIKQLTLFKGMHFDQTISAIHEDDQVSSVSMASVSTANTVDERKFRTGMATLDANIAKLQQALQKTKQMLN